MLCNSMWENMYTSGEYAANNPGWHVEHSPWKAHNILKLLRKNGLEPTSVCEVGCGAGEILRCLCAEMCKCNFVGYEISPQAFNVARSKSTDRLKFRFGEAFSDRETFDVAMAIDVFEHVDDYIGFVRSMAGKGKFKVYHIPLDLSVQMLLRGKPLITMRHSVGHIHSFTKDTALETLAYTGQQILDWAYTGAVDLPHKSLKSQFAKWPRKLMFSINPDFAVRLLGGYSLLVLCK